MLTNELRINSKKKLKEYLQKESTLYECGLLQRIFCISEKAILRKHQILLRKTEYYTNIHSVVLKNIYRFKLCLLQNKYSLHIPINCCEEGLHIMHLGPVLINNKAVLGKKCSLHVNSAIVANGITDEAPHLGDNVVVGIGAVIIGPIYLADNIAVGANALVNRNFMEENIAIAGIPAKKISNNGSLEWNKQKTQEVPQ